MEPQISEGQDKKQLIADVTALGENGWILDDEAVGLRKTYHFKTYTKALVSSGQSYRLQAPSVSDSLQDFLYTIGVRSKSKNHHSVMTIVRFTPLLRSILL